MGTIRYALILTGTRMLRRVRVPMTNVSSTFVRPTRGPTIRQCATTIGSSKWKSVSGDKIVILSSGPSCARKYDSIPRCSVAALKYDPLGCSAILLDSKERNKRAQHQCSIGLPLEIDRCTENRVCSLN